MPYSGSSGFRLSPTARAWPSALGGRPFLVCVPSARTAPPATSWTSVVAAPGGVWVVPFVAAVVIIRAPGLTSGARRGSRVVVPRARFSIGLGAWPPHASVDVYVT